MTQIRWPMALDEYEAQFDDVPDALAARESERMSLEAPWPFLIVVGVSILGWGCIVSLGVMAAGFAALVLQ